MAKNGKKRWIAAFGLLALSSALVGCGGGDSSSSAAVASGYAYGLGSINCASGYINLGTGCVYYSGSMQIDCQASGGYLYNINGTEVCRTVSTPAYTSPSTFPVLQAGVPSGEAANLGINLYYGDKLAITSNGGWGDYAYNSGGSQCDEVSTNGSVLHSCTLGGTSYTSGGLLTYDGSPAGLTGMAVPADGTLPVTFYVGSNYSGNVLWASGSSGASAQLSLGFNTPYISGTLCSNAVITSIQVTRCVDYSGNTYTCS